MEDAEASLTRLSGAGLPIAGSAATAATDERERRFGFFRTHTPAQTARGGILEGSSAYSAYFTSHAEYVVLPPRATLVNAVLRTPSVSAYRSTVVVAYQVRDASGNTHVDSSLSVAAEVQHEDGRVTTEPGSCRWSFSMGGIGECKVALPDKWFASPARANVTVSIDYDNIEVARSVAGTVGLQEKPTHPSLEGAGMVATMATGPVYAGDIFSVKVHGHTGSPRYALAAWKVTLSYDAKRLELQSQSSQFSRLYKDATVNHKTKGKLIANTADLAPGIHESAVQDKKDLHLATFMFKVLDTIAAGKYDDVLNMSVDSMINTGNNQYVGTHGPQPGQINDLRGDAQLSGQLEVAPDASVVAVLAYPATAELINTAVLNDTDVKVEISVVQLTDRPSQPMAITTASSDFSCSAANATELFELVVGAPCTVLLTSSQTQGGTASVLVTSQQGGTHASVPLTVWFPLQLSVQVADGVLNRIGGSEKCASPLYQHTEATAVAVFGGAGLVNVSNVDVTDLVSLKASDSSVTLSEGVVYALSPGIASVTVSGASVSVTPASVSVVEQVVTVTSLRSAVVTGVVWSQRPPVKVAWAVSTRFPARMQLLQRLRAEGNRGTVEASVVFSDGQSWLVPFGELNVTSSSPNLLVHSTPDSPWEVEVPKGAVAECGEIVRVAWNCCPAVTLASSFAPVDVQMPNADSLTITISKKKLAPPRNSAAVAPISVPTSANVDIFVSFSDDTSKVFTSDARTVITIDDRDARCASYDGKHGLQVHDGATCDQVRLTATVSAYGLSANASVPLVRFVSLALTLLPFPAFRGSDAILMETLRVMDCSSVHQLAQARVVGTLSDGSKTDVTRASATAVFLDISGIATVDNSLSSRYVLRPVSIGNVTVNASFNHREMASFAIMISDEPTRITEIALTLPTLGSGDYMSFHSQQNDVAQSAVLVKFGDGTQLNDAMSRGISGFSPGLDLLSFASDNHAAVNVTANVAGGFTLLDNHWGAVALTASVACPGSSVESSERHVYANLLAALDDVDLGQRTGLQFQQDGDTVEVMVRVNAFDPLRHSRLVGFQIEIEFDSTVLEVTSCSAGNTGDFSCTIKDPVYKVLMIGTNPKEGTTRNADLLLGTFSLRVKASGVTRIDGGIIELIRSDTNSASPTQLQRIYADSPGVQISAGRGYVATTASGRRLQASRLSVPAHTLAPRRRLASPRRLSDDALSCHKGIYGDIAGGDGTFDTDGAFTAFDVLRAKEIVAGIYPVSSHCQWAQEQLDPDLSGGAPKLLDARYLTLAMAKKLRFLVEYRLDDVGVQVGSSADLVVSVRLLNEKSEPAALQTNVRMEFSYSGDAVYSVGSADESVGSADKNPNNHWVAYANNSGDGYYRVAVHPAAGWAAGRVGVSVLVETVDATGQGETKRNWPFPGSSIKQYTSLGFSFMPLLEASVTVGQPLPPLAPPPPQTLGHTLSMRRSWNWQGAPRDSDPIVGVGPRKVRPSVWYLPGGSKDGLPREDRSGGGAEQRRTRSRPRRRSTGGAGSR